MKCKILCILLACVMLFSTMTTAFAASSEAAEAAESLHALGLFNGTGTNEDGTPNYDLDREPSRAEAVTMLVRLLGKEEEAKNGTWTTPFTDVADWAKPYVGYAYTNGLTSGTSATTFGGTATVTASQYLTFILRALGYQSGTDFQWDKAWELSDKIGLTDERYVSNEQFFSRGDVANISYTALTTATKGSNTPLYVKNGISMGQPVDGLQRLNLGTTKTFGHIMLAEYQGKLCTYDGPWDVRVTTRDGEPYDYDADSFDMIFHDFKTWPNDNPYVAGELKIDNWEWNDSWGWTSTGERPYQYSRKDEYISATDTLEVFELTYNGKTFKSMTAEEFNAAGLKDGDSGVWNGVRFVVSKYSIWGYTCYNLNDLADYFGIDKNLHVVDGTSTGDDSYWIISE